MRGFLETLAGLALLALFFLQLTGLGDFLLHLASGGKLWGG